MTPDERNLTAAEHLAANVLGFLAALILIFAILTAVS